MMRSRRDFLRIFGLAMAGMGLGSRRALAAPCKRVLPSLDLDFLADKLVLHRRSEWTQTPPRMWRMRAGGTYDRLTIHHAGNGVEKASDEQVVRHKLDGVLTAHMDRNYGDVGYHFIIDYAGRVWECRSLAYEGAHVVYQNDRNLGIMLLGNFEKQDPSIVQVEACETLVQLLRSRYRIKQHRVYGHRDLGQSACPGRQLYSHVLRFRGQDGSGRLGKS